MAGYAVQQKVKGEQGRVSDTKPTEVNGSSPIDSRRLCIRPKGPNLKPAEVNVKADVNELWIRPYTKKWAVSRVFSTRDPQFWNLFPSQSS